MRNASYVAILCGILLAVPGCGGKKVEEPQVDTDTFRDTQFYQSQRGIGSQKAFETFLKGQDPANKVKYINKSLEEGPAKIYAFKSVYEQFVNDPSPEVAAAAKDAISKAPTQQEYEASQKEELEKMKK